MEYALVAIVGACVGSFINVVIYRLPRRESVVGPGSHCTDCMHSLAWCDKLPVVSFLLSGRRCRYCGTAIGWHYLVVEVGTALLGLICVAAFGWTVVALRYAVVACLLLAAGEIDRRHGIIPNRLVVAGGGLGVALTLSTEPAGFPVLVFAAVVSFVLLLAVRAGSRLVFGHAGMGMGDVKLVASSALFLGWEALWVLYLAVVIAATVGVIGMWTGRLERSTPVPFAPFLAMGAMLHLFVLSPSILLPL